MRKASSIMAESSGSVSTRTTPSVGSRQREDPRGVGRRCATPGLDAVYIGPADLSFALGLPPGPDKTDAVHMATCDKIREAAHKHGIKACMHCASAAFAAGSVKRGFDLVMLTSDLASMIAGVRRQLDELKTATA